jgi:hypothetical protein
MDTASVLISVLGILGTLGGVVIGAWFTGRNERLLLQESHRREDRRARIDACVEFLTVFRQFRTYVLTHEVATVVQPGDDGRDVAFVKDAPEYTDAVQRVIGQLRLLEGGQGPIVEAAKGVQEAHRKLVLARARGGSAGVPPELMETARGAERQFTRVAHQELSLSALPQ